MNVPVTPNSTLKKNIIRSLRRQGLGDKFNLLVRELPGKSVLHKLSNTTAFNTRARCGRPGCLPCDSGDLGSKGACWLNGPTYEIKCGPCEADGKVATYVGE